MEVTSLLGIGAPAMGRNAPRVWRILLIAGVACCNPRLVLAMPQQVFGNPAVTHRPPARTYHIENYKLTLHFDQARGEVFGDEEVTLEPLGSSFNHFYLDSSGLSIEHVMLRGLGDQTFPLAFRTGGSRLRIALNHAYGRGKSLRVEIKYRGFPRAGLYFVHPSAAHPNAPREIWSQGEPEFNHFWFPCWDYPNDMSTSEMIIAVPAGQSAVSNGKLVNVVRQGSEVVYDWVESVPHSSYLTSLAVGPWRKVSDHYGRLPVDYYVPRTVNATTARRSFHLTPDMIGFFSSALGVAYPYEKYAQVTVSGYFFGGMENVSATTLTDTTLHDARAEADYPSQALVAHELGQHWFGDLVQGRDWADIWLNEGFATYLEALYSQDHEGNEAFRLQMMRDQEAAEQEDREHLRPLVDSHYRDPLQMFDAITHEKGAVVLDMLRNVLDGAMAAQPASQRELFFRALRAYLTRYRAQAVDTRALIRTLQSATGRKLDWFFHEWVYMAGHPDYRVTTQYEQGASIERLKVAQTQKSPGVERAFAMPIEVDFYGARGQARRVVLDDHERVQEFAVPLAFKPLWVDFDPHDVIEKTLVLSQPLQALVAKAQRDPAMMSRLSAVRALGALSDPDRELAVTALQGALEHDAFHGVRAYAARSLGRLHTPGAKAALLAALDEPDDRVRVAVVQALSAFHGDPAAGAALIARLEHDPSYAVQAAAAKAIGGSGIPDALAVLARVTVSERDRHVLAGVFAGLAATGDPRAVPILLRYARAGTPATLRIEALQALARTRRRAIGNDHEELVATVRAALDDSETSIRQAGEAVAGAWVLNELGPEISELARRAPTAFERDAADGALRQLRIQPPMRHVP